MRIAVFLSRIVGGEPSPALQGHRSHPTGSPSFGSSMFLVISTADCCRGPSKLFNSIRERQRAEATSSCVE